jgi:hypothetical protein
MKSFYVQSGSPQHWTQTQDDKVRRGTGSETVHDQVTLFWNSRQNHLTIPLGKNNNIATFHTAPGYNKFEAYEQELDNPIIATPAQIVSDEEDDNKVHPGSHDSPPIDPEREEWCQPIRTTFDLDLKGSQQGRPTIIKDEEDRQPTSTAAELLRYQHKFGHVSFAKLQEMAKTGTIPKRLTKCPVPACSACLYTKAIRRKWQSQTSNNREE